MSQFDIFIQLLTLSAMIATALVAAFFRRGIDDMAMQALFLFFIMTSALWCGIFFIEVVLDISRSSVEYIKWRSIIFRGGHSVIALWLLYALYRHK